MRLLLFCSSTCRDCRGCCSFTFCYCAENIKTFLDRSVPNVRVVSDGEHAVELLKTFTPDAIVMDYRLPGMNGLDTYTEMSHGTLKKMDCVMITGDATEALSQSASERGIRSVLTKPFSFAQLLDRLEPPLPAAADEAGGLSDKEEDSSTQEGKK